MVSRSGIALWSIGTGYIANRLLTGRRLIANDTIYTENHIDKLVMQSDCNLVVYQGTVIWSTGTGGSSDAYLPLESDGELRVVPFSGARVWSSPAA